MLIEPLAPQKIDAAVELWEAAGLTRPWNDPLEDLRRALAAADATVLAGIGDDGLIATAMVGHDGHRGWVYYLAVREDARRCGHGAAMMRACETWLARRGVAEAQRHGSRRQRRHARFYAALGYGADDVVVLSRRLR